MSSALNTTESRHLLAVVLVGIPGLEDLYPWLMIPLCFLYVLSVAGNSILLFLIKSDVTLQTPMYGFVSMLAITDLGLSLVTLPTVLGVFCFQSMKLPVPVCLAQMFLIHSLSVMESSVLLSMAYDRFVAICHPLRYSSLLTSPHVCRLGLLTVLRGIAVILPIPVLLQRSILCKSNVLSHAFCLHPDVIRLLCSRLTANNAYSIFAVISTMGLDALLIILSYALIMRAVCRLRSMSECCKAFHTCVCHVSMVLLFYSPMICLSLIHRFGGHRSHVLHVPMAYLHFLLPPALNPIVYGIKTKRIYRRISHTLRCVPLHQV